MTRFAYFCGHEQFQPEDVVRHAVLAEEAGFDAVMVSEHFHPWVDDVSASGFAFSTLGAIATSTERVELATAVTTPLFRYHPAVVAQAAATIDRLSDGRFRLGVGTGENLNEGPLGYSFPKYAERAARMSEALEIMRRLLDGEKLTFDGEFYTTDRAKLYSPPISDLPIWMAAGGPKSAALAATMAEGIITSVRDPETTMGLSTLPVKPQPLPVVDLPRSPRVAGPFELNPSQRRGKRSALGEGYALPVVSKRLIPQTFGSERTNSIATRFCPPTPSCPTPRATSMPTGLWSPRSVPTSSRFRRPHSIKRRRSRCLGPRCCLRCVRSGTRRSPLR